jgi:hypothetical protein
VLPCVIETAVRALVYLEVAQRCPERLPGHLPVLTGILSTMLKHLGTWDAPANGRDLLSLLEQNEWNVTDVAGLLGVARMTIYNRLRRMRVKLPKRRRGRSPKKGSPP